jgi:hypothetical protein
MCNPLQEYGNEFLFFIPNAFTPNGDMNNDYFKPVVNTTGVKEYEYGYL